MRLVRWVAGAPFLAVLVLAVGAGSASAAKEFTLDARPNVGDPAIAVDAAGVAHIVWNERGAVGAGSTLHYCQVPRDKRACSHKLTFNLPAIDFDGPKVFVPEPGRVLLATARCCTNDSPGGTKVFVFTSTDGGASFGAPVHVGNGNLDYARLGPGAFSLSSVSDVRTGGTFFQAAPLGGPPVTDQPNLGEIAGDIVGAAYNGSIAFADPLTPIVAMDDLGQVYFRRFGGGTAYNDPAAWGPLTPVGAGDDARLAGLLSGKRGVHLLMRVGAPGERRYVARRYDGSGFGPSVNVSERGDPIFREFFMDPSGRLHGLWVDNSKDSLKHRAAKAAKSWGSTETLGGKGKADDVYGIRSDAATDGGGFAVYDGNGEGPIRAIQYGPTGPVGGGGGEDGECVDSVTIGKAVVLAQEDCLERKGDRYTTGGDIRVNGMDVRVGGAKVTIDKGERTLVTSGKVEVRIGNVILGEQPLSWRLPPGTGQMEDLAGNPAEFNTGAFGIDFLGLDVLGYTVPEIAEGGKSAIPINLSLPAPFDSVLGDQATGRVVLHATNDGGLEVGNLRIQVQNVSLGIATIENFEIEYIGDPLLLFGKTNILIPPLGAELGAEFQLREGDFDYAKGEFTFPTGSLMVATDVFLRKIAFEVQKASSCGKPTKIGGSVTFVAEPVVAGTALISVEGGVSYSFPQASCGLPGVLEINGKGALAGFEVATLESRLTTDGQFTFKTALDLDLDVARIFIQMEGGIDIPAEAFYAAGKASIEAFGQELFGADTIISTEGIATCVSILVGEMGFEYRWGEDFGLDNFDAPPFCDIDIESYKPQAFKSSAFTPVGRAAGSGSFRLPRGLPMAGVRLDGAAGAPRFTLTGPRGLRIAFDGQQVGNRRFAVVPSGNQAIVRINRPAAGRYTVTDAAGSAITSLAVAHGRPEPSVKATVGGRGRARVLRFSSPRVRGQRLRFVEEGKGVRIPIATTRRARGRLRFEPASGPRGRRTIFAIVEQDGMPRALLRVARYTAPGPLRPSRPRNLRLRRRGNRLLVGWGRSRGATRYAVSWALRDGRRQGTITRRRRVAIKGVPGIDGGTIKVAGLRRDNVAGPAARAKLKPKPKKVKRGKRPGKRRRR